MPKTQTKKMTQAEKEAAEKAAEEEKAEKKAAAERKKKEQAEKKAAAEAEKAEKKRLEDAKAKSNEDENKQAEAATSSRAADAVEEAPEAAPDADEKNEKPKNGEGEEQSAAGVAQKPDENKKNESAPIIIRECGVCKEALVDEDGDALQGKYRCKNCNKVAQRISRLMRDEARDGEEWTSEWIDTGRMTPEERKDFYVSARKFVGPAQLKASMLSKIEEIKTRTNTQKWAASENFMDEDDLREKYKSKPEILANVLKNATQFRCPIRGCTMFADVSYNSNRVTTETEARHVKRSLDTNEDHKGEKRPKKAIADAKPKREKPPPKPQQLTTAQVTALQKTHKLFVGLTEKIDGQMKLAQQDDVVELMPKFLISKSRIVLQDLESEMELITDAVEKREAEKTLKASNKKTREETEAFLNDLNGALTMAQRHASLEAQAAL